MNKDNRFSRRSLFSSAASLAAAPAILGQRNANDRIGVAMVGVGTRGIYLLERAQECPNTEVRIICDLYDSNLKRAAATAVNKKVQLTKEWEKAVSSPDIDAVFIAAPDFWHAQMAVRAAEMKKHVYVEKALCRTLPEAKAIRKAVRDNKVVLQLGHHQNSDPYFIKAREIYRSGQLGKMALVRTYIDRTNPWPEWQFYTAYNIQQTPRDATAGDHRLEALHRQCSGDSLRRRAVLPVALLVGVRHGHRGRPDEPPVGRRQHDRGHGHPGGRANHGRALFLEAGPRSAGPVARDVRVPQEGDERHLRLHLPQPASWDEHLHLRPRRDDRGGRRPGAACTARNGSPIMRRSWRRRAKRPRRRGLPRQRRRGAGLRDEDGANWKSPRHQRDFLDCIRSGESRAAAWTAPGKRPWRS